MTAKPLSRPKQEVLDIRTTFAQLPHRTTTPAFLNPVNRSLLQRLLHPFSFQLFSRRRGRRATRALYIRDAGLLPRRFDGRAFFTWATFSYSRHHLAPESTHPLRLIRSTHTQAPSPCRLAHRGLLFRPLHPLHAPNPVLAPPTTPLRTSSPHSSSPTASTSTLSLSAPAVHNEQLKIFQHLA